MRIIVGVDDSPCSTAALEFVKSSAWPAGSQITVVSAAVPQVAVYTEVYAPSTGAYQQVVEDQMRYHEEVAARAELALRETGLRTQSRVLQGDPREVLIDVAHRENADLIVVGSHGRTGLSKLLVGSVATHVVTHAPCSVLVVRRKRGA